MALECEPNPNDEEFAQAFSNANHFMLGVTIAEEAGYPDVSDEIQKDALTAFSEASKLATRDLEITLESSATDNF